MRVSPSVDGIRIDFEGVEVDVLKGLFDEYSDLLAAPDARDPVVERLFPAAYEEPELQRQWVELAGDDLIDTKRTSLASAAEQLRSPLELNGEQVERWLAVINDLRLAIGTRLDVDEERMAAPIRGDDPQAQALTVMHWLGWMQEEILQILLS